MSAVIGSAVEYGLRIDRQPPLNNTRRARGHPARGTRPNAPTNRRADTPEGPAKASTRHMPDERQLTTREAGEPALGAGGRSTVSSGGSSADSETKQPRRGTHRRLEELVLEVTERRALHSRLDRRRGSLGRLGGRGSLSLSSRGGLLDSGSRGSNLDGLHNGRGLNNRGSDGRSSNFGGH